MTVQRGPEAQVDVLIVTAVKDEWDAVLAVGTGATAGSTWETRTEGKGPEVSYRDFMTEWGVLRIAVVQAFGMGREQAAIAAAPLLERHPEIRCLAMCGVCAGRRGLVELGDVIIADRTWPYDAGKLKATVDEEGHHTARLQGDMDLYRIHPAEWKQRAERFQIDPAAPWLKERPRSYEEQGDWVLERLVKNEDPRTHAERKTKCPDWRAVLEQLWKIKRLEEGELKLTDTGRKHIDRRLMLEPDGLHESEPFKIVVGPVASGAPVVQDPTIFERLSDTQAMRKVVGLEMETSAILGLAYLRKVPFAVVMKGVMDYADALKSDNMKTFAAKASAECLIAFLRQNLPPDDSLFVVAHGGERASVDSARVFISYTHDSEQHEAKVLELANRLCADGINAWVDRYHPPPLEGWSQWREHQLEAAQKTVIICTETYYERFHVLHPKTNREQQFVPVVFSPKDKRYIPSALADSKVYCLDADYLALAQTLPRSTRPLARRHLQSPGEPIEPGSGTPRTSSKKAAKPLKKVLIVAANRDGDPPLALGREIREIAAALRGSSSKFEVYILWAATNNDLRAEILRVKPHILHFCGHGTAAGPILEHTERGNEALDGKALRKWLKVALKGIDLDIALLNFCDSQEMLDDLAGVAPVIVGPIHRIADEHAIAFSSAFYIALAAGGNASFSYYLGKSAVSMAVSDVEPGEPTRTRDLSQPLSLTESQTGPYGIRSRTADEVPTFDGTPRSRRRAFVFFASEPEGRERLRLDRELRRILDVFPRHASFSLEQRWATRAIDLLHALMDTFPAIIHIAGHGTPAGGFLFEHDRYHNGVVAPSYSLARVLMAFRQHIECAVLMFGHSDRVAHKLEDVLDCVVAVHGPLLNDISVTFSNAFYQMLDNGKSYRDAFGAAIALLPETSADVISLHGRNLDKAVAGVTRRVGLRTRGRV